MNNILHYLNDLDLLKRYLGLNEISRRIEFSARFILVNFPLYILAKSPELDRVCSISTSYMYFQIVGFCWAFLVNAAFALACQSSMFVPGTVSTSLLILNFYVYYSSIRTVIEFAQYNSYIAFETIQDYKHLSGYLEKYGAKVFKIYHFMFLPCILLEICLLLSDSVCKNISNPDSHVLNTICKTSGLSFLTSDNQATRYTLFLSLCVVVLQIWQFFLYQFPQWTNAFRALSRPVRRIYQLSAVLLIFSQFSIAPLIIMGLTAEDSGIAILFGWSVWLYCFIPTLLQKYKESWDAKNNKLYAQNLAIYLRISLVMILSVIFILIYFSSGILKANLELTFITINVPVIYTIIYILCLVGPRISIVFMLVCVPIAMLATGLLTFGGFSSVGGQGTFLLVCVHIIFKMLQYFGVDDGAISDDDINEESIGNLDIVRSCNDLSSLVSDTNKPNIKKTYSSASLQSQLTSVSSTEELSSLALDQLPTPVKGAIASLSERGANNSSLVSINMNKSLRDHWAIRMSQRILSFFINLTRKLAVVDSLTSGIMRLAIAFAVVCTVFLSVISLASIVQQNLKLFPKLIHFRETPDSYIFDHTITTLTLNKKGILSNENNKSLRNNTCSTKESSLKFPSYLSCDLEWNDYTLLDLAILSEIAYLDDENIGTIVTSLLPHHKISNISSNRRIERGPMYIEISDKEKNLVIIAIRGTDVTRLHDFLEDFKLYTEPVVFSLLSTVFPTMHFWTHDTTSLVIQTLYQFNSFFGLKGEAEYYQPLMKRVSELSTNGEKVIITGHSLGGGLARIVGLLTGETSVSFSPPGIGLSYRKYSAYTIQGEKRSINLSGQLHHQSFSIVTEYDWITQLDQQVGLVQKIICDKEEKAHQNACHLLEGTICHLLEHCGDKYGRFEGCEYTFDFSQLYPSIFDFFHGHKFIILPILLIIILIISLAIIPDML